MLETDHHWGLTSGNGAAITLCMPTIPGHTVEYSPLYGYAVFTAGARVERVSGWYTGPFAAFAAFQRFRR